jgi:hypothetical protein
MENHNIKSLLDDATGIPFDVLDDPFLYDLDVDDELEALEEKIIRDREKTKQSNGINEGE